MLLRDLQTYIDAAKGSREIGVAVYSAETGHQIAVSYDVAAGDSEYGELILEIQVETQA
jgi:hypothetical protein